MKLRIILPLGFSFLCAMGTAMAADLDSAFENQVELSGHQVKLRPAVRAEALETATAEIPLDSIYSFLVNHRVVESNELDQASYVVAGKNGQIIMGKGDIFYARGHFDVPEGSVFGIYQKGNLYKDPETGEALGLELVELGLARVEELNGDIAKMQLLSSHRDIHIGDRLLPTVEQKLDSVFLPKSPSLPVEGEIIQVINGMRNIGSYTSVVINKGKRDGLVSGDLLSIHAQDEQVLNALTKKKIKLPRNYAGTLMIYRTFDKVSFGLVLKAEQAMKLHDVVKNP